MKFNRLKARHLAPGDRLVTRGGEGSELTREVESATAHLGGREVHLKFTDGSASILPRDHMCRVEASSAPVRA